MIFGSLFAGIGGFDLACEQAGLSCAFQVEIDKNCQAVLSKHWPNVERFDDIKAFNATGFHIQPDLICGGFPCQDLSVAGRRAGLVGQRSGLWWEFARIIGESTPRWILIENVVGLLSSNEGRDMGAILWSLGKLGYGWAYRCLNAQHFGVAQRRRRIFIVGCLGDCRRAAQVLFEPESVYGHSPPRREAGSGIAGAITKSIGSGGADDNRAQAGQLAHAHKQTGVGGMVSRRLNAGGMGRQDYETETMIPVGVPEGGFFSGGVDGVAHSLRAEGADASEDGTGRGTPIIPVAFNWQSGGSANFVGGKKNITDALHKSQTPAVCLQSGVQRESAYTTYAVRRLTPREAERLQGFPDDFTKYDPSGKQLSDSARYKMLGNSVAVPVVRWIAERIAACERGEL